MPTEPLRDSEGRQVGVVHLEPTGYLRFVERGHYRILQQEFRAQSGVKVWRDVPLEVETENRAPGGQGSPSGDDRGSGGINRPDEASDAVRASEAPHDEAREDRDAALADDENLDAGR